MTLYKHHACRHCPPYLLIILSLLTQGPVKRKFLSHLLTVCPFNFSDTQNCLHWTTNWLKFGSTIEPTVN